MKGVVSVYTASFYLISDFFLFGVIFCGRPPLATAKQIEFLNGYTPRKFEENHIFFN